MAGPPSRLRVTVHVLGTGAEGTHPSLYVAAERRAQYGEEYTLLEAALVNAGEGTRRLCNERRLKLNKVAAVFLTRSSPSCLLGLPSVIFALADGGVGELSVVGAPPAADVVESVFPHFVRRKTPEVRACNSVGDCWRCAVGEDHGTCEDAPPAPVGPTPTMGESLFQMAALHLEWDASPWLCYALRCGRGGGLAVVVDCPSVAAVAALAAAPQLLDLQHRSHVGLHAAVIHVAAACVTSSAAYAAWAAGFSPDTMRHVFVDQPLWGPPHTVFTTQAVQQDKFHGAAPDTFHSPVAAYPWAATRVVLSPQPAMEGSAVTPMPTACHDAWCWFCGGGGDGGAGREAWGGSGAPHTVSCNKAAAACLKAELSGEASVVTEPAAEQQPPRLLFLGTGSAAPSLTRASSGLYLRLPCAALPHRGFLLDCGEGVVGQLVRHFGDGAVGVILGLTAVWISHHHADHMGGVMGLIDLHSRLAAVVPEPARPPPLLVMGSPRVGRVVTGFFSAYCNPTACRFVPTEDANNPTHPCRGVFQPPSAPSPLDVWSFRSVPVQHCEGAYGLVLLLRNGLKFVYSGDTRPCRALVAAGLGAGVLVHEATFDDTLSAHAVRKRHSTVSEAVRIAGEMGARHLVLTHLSQRYPAFPQDVTVGGALPRTPVVAFDGMWVELTDAGLDAVREACVALRGILEPTAP